MMLVPPSTMTSGLKSVRTGTSACHFISSTRLLCAVREHNYPHGLNENCQIQEKVIVLHIVEIESELLPRILDRLAITVIHLCPASDARFDAMTKVIIGHLAAQLLDEIRPFGPRPNKAHISFQHVNNLGNLVDPRGADEFSDP